MREFFGSHRSDALYQGTTSVVPKRPNKDEGFSPCGAALTTEHRGVEPALSFWFSHKLFSPYINPATSSGLYQGYVLYSLLLSRPPVQNHVQGRCFLGFVADNQEPFPVRSNIPAHGPGADSGIHHVRVEQGLRYAGLENRRGAHGHRHHGPVR